ncbi:MAG: hypothetical protein AAGC71_05175 [Pseudomonadota bacterium]
MTKRNSGFYRNPEMLVGISAVFIGLAALGVSLFEAHLMRQEQRAAVLPILELSQSFDIDESSTEQATWRFSLQAHNVGIGPAIIRDFVVLADGKRQATWNDAMQVITASTAGLPYRQSWINGRTIPPGGQVVMFDYVGPVNLSKIATQSKRLQFEACYCSVFNECWRVEFGTAGTTRATDNCASTRDAVVFNE